MKPNLSKLVPGLLFAFFLSLSGITGTHLSSAAPLKSESAKVTAQGINPELKVIPGGQTIGVKVKSAGVLVVGHHQIEVSEKSKLSPGEISGLAPGDLMISMNGEKLDELSKVAKLVDRAGKANNSLTIVYKRAGKEHTAKLKPAYDIHDKVWRLGLYIRDSAAGVGTLTFYAPEQGVYGALGHVITDMNTGTPIVVGSGHIVQSSVTSISKSQDGDPGEKRAHFLKESQVLGNVESNTDFGIFGKMSRNPEHSLYKEPIPIAMNKQIKEGPAEILTVVDGQQVERFSVEVIHVAHQQTPATKGMVIRITDPRLIDKTGGIVQGMSGSPIVQNGRLIGAVTHVFVNDPKSGYGCFIEWMLKDSGVTLQEDRSILNLKAV